MSGPYCAQPLLICSQRIRPGPYFVAGTCSGAYSQLFILFIFRSLRAGHSALTSAAAICSLLICMPWLSMSRNSILMGYASTQILFLVALLRKIFLLSILPSTLLLCSTTSNRNSTRTPTPSLCTTMTCLLTSPHPPLIKNQRLAFPNAKKGLTVAP